MPSTLELDGERAALLATGPATDADRRLALTTIAASVLIFLTLVPFAKVPLPKLLEFVPAYQFALVVNDVITAFLLYRQFDLLRTRGLLLLASGYLFTAMMAVAHALTFPGLFSDNGLLGAGPQTTAWLYMFWHAGFPVLVIAYAFAGHGQEPQLRGSAAMSTLLSILAVFMAVLALAFIATAGQDRMPAIMLGNHYTPAMIAVVSSVWLFSILALLFLWRRRPHTVLDLWLMVVMCSWIFDIALAAVLNAGRFDVGFYAGRIYGLLASSFVLVILIWRAE